MATQNNSVKSNIQHSTSASVPSTVKNITIGFSGQPGKLTVKDENQNETFSDNYVTPTGAKLDLSDTGTYSESLNDQDWRVVTSTLTANSGGRLLAMPSATIYEGSVSAGNEIPDGSNVNNQDWEFHMWIDWGDSDNDNVVHKTFLTNVSGVTKTLVYRINFRYILEEASL